MTENIRKDYKIFTDHIEIGKAGYRVRIHFENIAELKRKMKELSDEGYVFDANIS